MVSATPIQVGLVTSDASPGDLVTVEPAPSPPWKEGANAIEGEAIARCRSLHASFKCHRIIVVSELPKTHPGKGPTEHAARPKGVVSRRQVVDASLLLAPRHLERGPQR